ncbi:MAG: hypothetical protein ACH34V_09410 [Flavobacterium sp.]
MKVFFLFIGKIMVVLLLSAFALDLGYSYVYSKSTTRNKVENVINSTGKKFDVIMMGSSRANNHFVAELFVDRGYKAFNYGISGSKLQETALLLELMMANDFEIKNLILEVDLNINSDTYSFGNQAKYMPFITTNSLISNYYQDKLLDYNIVVYAPFYRYIKYEPQIGFREMVFSLMKRPSNSLLNYGLYPLINEGKNMSHDLTDKAPKRNLSYELIKKICKENDIRLIVVTTPLCENTKGMDYFSKINSIYPEILNYENCVVEDKYFSSCGHLNYEGAKMLTSKIINDFF